MLTRTTRSPRFAAGSNTLAAAMALMAAAGMAHAGDVTWDNGAGSLLWDTSSLNWSGAAWSNANGDGAIFGATGAGAISVPGPVTARSLNFQVSGYSLSGPGPISLTGGGASTLAAGVLSVAAGNAATSNTTISSSIGMVKLGDGSLQMGGTNSIAGSIQLAGAAANVWASVLVGDANGNDGGTLTLSAGALDPTTKVSVTAGTLDLGSNNVTLGGLIFRNPALNAVIGSGTLLVNGDIHVLGDFNGPAGNVIMPNVDLGGGTQVVRVGANTFFGQQYACIFAGTLSNGSLFKTCGFQWTGNFTNADGMGLYGNNTYTGSTVVNNGTTVVTGTNATTSVLASGASVLSGITLQGASGSLGAATSIRIVGGARLTLDNNSSIAALTGSSFSVPAFPAAQNNDRIRDDAAVELRDASLAFTGQSTVAASETFGSLNLSGGHNLVTVTPNGTGGTAFLTCAGNLTMAPRATLALSGPSASPMGGAATRFFVNGTLPPADATGILPRVFGTGTNATDFMTYSATTGFTPFTGYTANSLTTPSVNVALTAATATSGSIAINALKTTGSFNTTITSPDVLTVTSGMVYSTSGTDTIAAGTLNFGSTPGVFFGSTTIGAAAAVTGTQGLIVSSGTCTLTGNLAGLSGPITINGGTVTLATNTFTGTIEHRSGTLNLNASQTSLGTVSIGVSAQESALLGTLPGVSISGAGANSTFNTNFVVDNGTQTLGGIPLLRQTPTFGPLSNSTGSQTLSGNFQLNTQLNLQGGGGSGTGATNFTGTVFGNAPMSIANGRVNFAPSSTLANAGGLVIAAGGFTAIVNFQGTATGSAPIILNGGSNANTGFSYVGPGSIYSGPITVQNSSGASSPTIIPVNTSTIGNTINLSGDVFANVASGVTATWAGPITGTGALTKSTGTGTLVLTSPASTHAGAVNVNAGTLVVDGVLPGSVATVNNGATLSGSGTVGGGVTVAAGGTLSPGDGLGIMSTGNLTVSGTLNYTMDLGSPHAASLLAVTGTITLNASSVLNISALNATAQSSGTYIVALNDGADAVTGTFGSITGLPAGVGATVNYAYSGTDTLGRLGTGNEIAITLTPLCYANCDGSTSTPLLNVADFTCFLQKFAQGDPYANCDGSTTVPQLNVADFTCFLQKFAGGCS
jgi:fibronectin-binding autotransporter adhesin